VDFIGVSRIAEGVARVELRRPEKRNALHRPMRDELLAALGQLAVDEGVRVVVLTGAGPVFCAGFDRDEMAAAGSANPERMAAADAFHHALLRFTLPMITAVNGPAIGGGFDVAVLTDLRVAADNATFSHPEQAWGEIVYRPLRDLVGGGLARELVLTGRTVEAAEARRIGLVSEVVPPDRLDAAAAEWATAIARAPRPVLVRMKAKIVAATAIPEDATTLEL
jgi:enoyl-CoA hydratase